MEYNLEVETNNVIQQLLLNYGEYTLDIEELISVGLTKEQATKIVTKRYKDFIIN